jgi:hypothetical protein
VTNATCAAAGQARGSDTGKINIDVLYMVGYVHTYTERGMAVLLCAQVLVLSTGRHLCLASLVSSCAVTLMLEKDPA